MELQKLSIKT